MKPVQDTFTSHIQGLYDGHEVAPPQGMKDSVFNQLDSEVSGSSGLTSKAVLVAALLSSGLLGSLCQKQTLWLNQILPSNKSSFLTKCVADEVVVVDEAVSLC